MRADAGSKRERIAIMTGAPTTDAEGNPVNKYGEKVTSVWARVQPSSAAGGRGEFQAMKHMASEVSHVFTVNFRLDFNVKMKIDWRGSMWNIHEIQPDESKFDMRLMASRVQ